MFEKAKAAGLTPQHIADFVRVTRVTASTWMNGHAKPHSILADRIDEFNAALDLAVADRRLPPPADMAGRKRRKYVFNALRCSGG
jgi:hypothetical protein